jgi:hypothetical protein
MSLVTKIQSQRLVENTQFSSSDDRTLLLDGPSL